MSDWFGLLFFVALVFVVIAGLKVLAKPRKTTGEEFEKNVSESASMLSASVNALNEMLNPEAAKSKEVQTQLKEGRFDKKKHEAKSEGGEVNSE